MPEPGGVKNKIVTEYRNADGEVSVDPEYAVAGAVLIGMVKPSEVGLLPGDFVSPSVCKLWAYLMELEQCEMPTTLAEVNQQMKNEKPELLAKIGGQLFLIGCKEQAPVSRELIPFWVDKVREKRKRAEEGLSLQPEPVPLDKERALADTLKVLFAGKYRYAAHRGKWMKYTSGCWRETIEEEVVTQASKELYNHFCRLLAEAGSDRLEADRIMGLIKDTFSRSTVVGAVKFLAGEPGFLTRAEEFDADPYLLNLRNGTLDLRTFELKPHNPDDLLTKQANVDYNPDANSEAWAEHLELFLPDPDIRRQVQRDLGMALVGAVLDEYLPIWYGCGANGKSTTAKVIMRILGDYAIKAAPGMLIQKKHDEHPTQIADLCGRRVVFSVEIDQGKKLAEALVKDLTGGDKQKARFVRQDYFEFEQTFNIFLLVNHKPVVGGTDTAIWRRIRLIPWTQTVPEDKRRPQDEVTAELSSGNNGCAVLNWILDGLRDWQKNHWWIAEQVKAATEEYRAEMDVLGAFLRDCCEEKEYVSVPVKELYEAYLRWCEDMGCDAVSKKTFSERLRDRGFAITRRGHNMQTVVLNIRLQKAGEDTAQRECNVMQRHVPVNPPENSIHGGNTENHVASRCTSPQREEEDPFAD
jgi:putative DNA primase/helicase